MLRLQAENQEAGPGAPVPEAQVPAAVEEKTVSLPHRLFGGLGWVQTRHIRYICGLPVLIGW